MSFIQTITNYVCLVWRTNTSWKHLHTKVTRDLLKYSQKGENLGLALNDKGGNVSIKSYVVGDLLESPCGGNSNRYHNIISNFHFSHYKSMET